MDEILTSEQVAQILQIHPFTVLKFIKQGKLKASKLGRVYRIRRSDVEKFLDSQTEQQTVQDESKTATKKTVKKPDPIPEKDLREKTPSDMEKTSQEEIKEHSDTTPHYTLKL